MTPHNVVLYGDFNCPWSYLAVRRAGMLASVGVAVEWRAVEHDCAVPGRHASAADRFEGMRADLERSSRLLLPGERLPHALAGFVPFTKPAIAGYAEACAAGVGDEVRDLLFEAFWVHGVDLGDARVVRTLLVDAIRSGHSPSDPLHEWGYAVDVTGGPVTTQAWRLIARWRTAWAELTGGTVPVLVADDAAPLVGVEAVAWLGATVERLGLDPDVEPQPSAGAPGSRDLEALSWVSQHGNRWQRRYQRAHESCVCGHAG